MSLTLTLTLVALCIFAMETKSFLFLEDATVDVGKHFLYQIGDKEFLETYRVYRVVERGQRGLPDWLNYVNHTSQLIGLPQESDIGMYTIRVRAECMDPSRSHCQDKISRTFHISVVEPLTAAESRGRRPVIIPAVHVATGAKHGKAKTKKTNSESEMQHKYTNLIQPTRTLMHENNYGASLSVTTLHGMNNSGILNLSSVDSSVQYDFFRHSLCDSNSISFFASLILHVVHGLSDFQVLDLKQRMSSFASKDVRLFSVTEGTAVLASLHNNSHKYIVTAGPGNVVESLNSSVELSWLVVCQDIDKLLDFTRVLQHNVEVGRITEELGYDVIAWFVYSDKPVPRRQKRSAHRQGRQTGTPSLSPPLPTTMTMPVSSLHDSFTVSSISVSSSLVEITWTPSISFSLELVLSSPEFSFFFTSLFISKTSSLFISKKSSFVEPKSSSDVLLSSYSFSSSLDISDSFGSSDLSLKLSSAVSSRSFITPSLSFSVQFSSSSAIVLSDSFSAKESITVYPILTFTISTRSKINSAFSSLFPNHSINVMSQNITPSSTLLSTTIVSEHFIDSGSLFQPVFSSILVFSSITSEVSSTLKSNFKTLISTNLVSPSTVFDISMTRSSQFQSSSVSTASTHLMSLRTSELSSFFIFSSISSLLPLTTTTFFSSYYPIRLSSSRFESTESPSSFSPTSLSSRESQVLNSSTLFTSTVLLSKEISDILPTFSFSTQSSFYSLYDTFSINTTFHVFPSVSQHSILTTDSSYYKQSLSPTFPTKSYSTHILSVTQDVSPLLSAFSSNFVPSEEMFKYFKSLSTVFSLFTSTTYIGTESSVTKADNSSSYIRLNSPSLSQYSSVSATSFMLFSSFSLPSSSSVGTSHYFSSAFNTQVSSTIFIIESQISFMSSVGLPLFSSDVFIKSSISILRSASYVLETSLRLSIESPFSFVSSVGLHLVSSDVFGENSISIFPNVSNTESSPGLSIESPIFLMSSDELPLASSDLYVESYFSISSLRFPLVSSFSSLPENIGSSPFIPSTSFLTSLFIPSTDLSSLLVPSRSVWSSTFATSFTDISSYLWSSNSILVSTVVPASSNVTQVPVPSKRVVSSSVVTPKITISSLMYITSMPLTNASSSTIVQSYKVLSSSLLSSTRFFSSTTVPSVNFFSSTLVSSVNVFSFSHLQSQSVLLTNKISPTNVFSTTFMPSFSVFSPSHLPSTHILSSAFVPLPTSVLPSSFVPTSILSSALTPTSVILSPSVVIPSSLQPVTSAIVSSTAAPDAVPILQAAIDHLEVYVGRYFELKIPEKTFNDTEDGSTSNLNLSISLVHGRPFPSDSWLMFDPGTRKLYGLPLMRDLESGETKQVLEKFILTAADSKGQTARDVISIAYKYDKDITHDITVQFDGEFGKFEGDRNTLIGVAQRIAKFYGDSDLKYLTFFEMENGSVIVNWGNNSLFGKECWRKEIQDNFDHLLEGNSTVSRNFSRLFSGIVPVSAVLDFKGVCLLPLTTLPSNKPPLKTDEDEQFWLTIGVPALVVILIIIIVALLLLICCRHRRPSKEMSHSDKPAFLEDRRPIIFPEELEMVDPSLKSKNPLILPSDYLVETPPAVPPHGLADPPTYKTPAFDDSVFEAEHTNAPPPPGVAETATDPPPYRLPPPYFNPHRALQNS